MAFDLNGLVRDNIKALVPYSSARGEYDGDAQIFLDANENAFGSPLGGQYNRYPDPLQSKLKSLISAHNNIAPNKIFIGNGSDEVIDLLIRVFCRPGEDNIMICPPTYGMYEVAANINDVAILRVNLTDEFELDTGAICETINDNTKIIFICSPNNPTGNSMSRESIIKITKSFNGIVVVDEAYIHYSDERSFIDALENCPNLLIMQTFSKAWGLAGLRVGFACANEQIIELLNKVKPPYNINQVSQSLVTKALQNKLSVEKTVEKTLAERKKLEHAFVKFSFVAEVYRSDANFLLTKVKDAKDLYLFLIKNGIVVRDRSNVMLCDECLRITVRTPKENQALLRAFEIYEKSIIY